MWTPLTIYSSDEEANGKPILVNFSNADAVMDFGAYRRIIFGHEHYANVQDSFHILNVLLSKRNI